MTNAVGLGVIILFFLALLILGGGVNGLLARWLTSRNHAFMQVVGVVVSTVLICDYAFTAIKSLWDAKLSGVERLATLIIYGSWSLCLVFGCVSGFRERATKKLSAKAS